MSRSLSQDGTNLDDEKLERDSVCAVHFVLKVEHRDEVALIYGGLLFRDTLGEYLSVIVQVTDGMVSRRFTVKLVGAGLVDAYPSCIGLGFELRLLHESLNHIFDSASLGDK